MKRIAFLLSAVLFFGCFSPQEGSTACFESHCFQLEVASTPWDKAKGLMFRESLSEDSGMLFVFSEDARHGF